MRCANGFPTCLAIGRVCGCTGSGLATGGGRVLLKALALRPRAARPVRTMNGARWIAVAPRKPPPRKPPKPPPPMPPPPMPRAKLASGAISAAPARARTAKPANFLIVAVSRVERRAAASLLGLETDRKRAPEVCRLSLRTDFHPKLTAWLEPTLTSRRLHSEGEIGEGDYGRPSQPWHCWICVRRRHRGRHARRRHGGEAARGPDGR